MAFVAAVSSVSRPAQFHTPPSQHTRAFTSHALTAVRDSTDRKAESSQWMPSSTWLAAWSVSLIATTSVRRQRRDFRATRLGAEPPEVRSSRPLSHSTEGLCSKQIEEEFKGVFELADMDNSGTINDRELQAAMRLLGFSLSDDELAVIMQDFAKDNNSEIDLEEFMQSLARRMSKPDDEVVKAVRLVRVVSRWGALLFDDDEIANASLRGVARQARKLRESMTHSDMSRLLGEVGQEEEDRSPRSAIPTRASSSSSSSSRTSIPARGVSSSSSSSSSSAIPAQDASWEQAQAPQSQASTGDADEATEPNSSGGFLKKLSMRLQGSQLPLPERGKSRSKLPTEPFGKSATASVRNVSFAPTSGGGLGYLFHTLTARVAVFLMKRRVTARMLAFLLQFDVVALALTPLLTGRFLIVLFRQPGSAEALTTLLRMPAVERGISQMLRFDAALAYVCEEPDAPELVGRLVGVEGLGSFFRRFI
ncbi:unnamed protein product, partial [Polarella glacialis]